MRWSVTVVILLEMVKDCDFATADGQRLSHATRDARRLQTCYRIWFEIRGTIKDMVRDRELATGDGQRLQALGKKWSGTADVLQEMVGDCELATERKMVRD